MDEQALLADLAKGDAKLLVIGGGVEDAARERLRAASPRLDLLVLEHFGCPAQLVDNISGVLG